MIIKSTSLLHLLLYVGLINAQLDTTAEQQSTQQSTEPFNVQSSDKNSSIQRCDDARLKCAFRLDCGQALTSYMIHCADLIAGTVDIDQCPTQCFKALIALASTEHGAKLVNCDCGDSQFCRLSKERVEVCKAKVEYEVAEDTVVNCSTAKFICSSNTQCLTALTYYNKFCRAMFKGKYCSKRCLNSLNILQRQKNANKLRTCVCDGTEDFPCESIKQNTEFLCLKKANYTSDTQIELLSDHRSKHRHHHHKYDSEHRRHRPHLRKRFHHTSADFDNNQIETAPIDIDQIKNFKYFDIMISEALSSKAIPVELPKLAAIIALVLFNCVLLFDSLYRF